MQEGGAGSRRQFHAAISSRRLKKLAGFPAEVYAKIIAGIFLTLGSVIIFIFAAFLYLPRLLDYKAGRDLYDEISRDYVVGPDTGKQIETEMEPVKPDIHSDKRGKDTDKDGDRGILAKYPCIDVDSDGLLDENIDYIGWIYIPGTGISYPVTKSGDNQDYLHKDFHKEPRYAGTIFMDCRCEKGVLNHHVVLYGHNMRDGSMFAGIKNYMDQEFADKHPVFWFITPGYKLAYRVFSVCTAFPDDQYQYGIDGIDFTDNMEFEEAVHKMQESTISAFDAGSLDGRSYIMSLSTCTGGSQSRCIVHGVLLGAA